MEFKWDTFLGTSTRVGAFLREVIKVCEKHNMSISHEDTQGGFEVSPFKEYAQWLAEARDFMNNTIVGFDTLRLKQFEITVLGQQVLGSMSAFVLWLSAPERKELFTNIDGLGTLREELIALDEGYF